MVGERVRPYVRGMNVRVKLCQNCHIQLFVCFRYYILLLSSYRYIFRVFVESKFEYSEYGGSSNRSLISYIYPINRGVCSISSYRCLVRYVFIFSLLIAKDLLISFQVQDFYFYSYHLSFSFLLFFHS